MSRPGRNLGLSVALVLFWAAHVFAVVPLVPEYLAIPVNLVFVPAILGYAVGVLLQLSNWTKALFLVAVDSITMLVLGSDPAAPSAQFWVGMFIGLSMLGGLAVHVATTRYRRKTPAA